MRPAVCSVCLVLITLLQSPAAQLPESALAVFGRMPFHNGSRIHMSTMSPDGKYLATLSSRSATVWDASTGQPVQRFFFAVPSWPGHRRGVAFSPDSKRFVCGPDNQNIYVWDLATGKEARRFTTAPDMYGYSFLRFSADGAAIIVQSNDEGEVTWRNIETGQTVHRLPYGGLKQLSPDEKTFVLVRASKKQVVIGDVASGKIKHTLPIAAVFDRSNELLFLSDGVTLAIVHKTLDAKRETDNEVQFWNVETGKRQERTWTQPKSAAWVSHDLALSPDGKVLYSSVRRYDLDENKELPAVPLLYASTVFPHPDGKTLFCVGWAEIRLFDLSAGKQVTRDADFLHWRETAISADGRWLALRGAIGREGTLELCDTKAYCVWRVPCPWNNGETIAFTADNDSVIVNQYYHLDFLKVPELKGFKKLAAPKGQSFDNASISVSKDGRYLSTRNSVARLRVFNLHDGQEIWSHEEIWKACFTPDSKRIVVDACDRSAVWLYDLATKKIVFEIKRPSDRSSLRWRHGASIADWAFSPNGRILALAMTGGHVVMLDAATGAERARFLAMDTNTSFGFGDWYFHVTKLAFSPDGQWLAGGGREGFLRIWDVATRRELHRLHGHEGETQALGFTADGRRLVSFGDGEGFVWDLRPKLGKPTADGFADLRADDGPTVYRALWRLADDPKAPDLLRRKLPVQRLDIRPERIKQLVTDLGSSSFSEREAAARELRALEENARPAFVAALENSPSLEATRRIQQILETLDNDATPSRLRAVRAVRAMDLQDSGKARTLLREWADGTPGLHLTQASRASIAAPASQTLMASTFLHRAGVEEEHECGGCFCRLWH